MGDSSRLGPDNVVTFINASEQDVAEVNRPNSVVDLLEADRMLRQRIGEKERSLPQSNRSCVRHAFHENVAGIFDRRQRARVRAPRGTVQDGRRPIAQRLVRSFVVVQGGTC